MRNVRRTSWLTLLLLLVGGLAVGPRSACALSRQDRQTSDACPAVGSFAHQASISGHGNLGRAFEGDLCELEQRLFADAADGRLDEFSLFEAALVASGVDGVEALQSYERQLDGLVRRLRASGTVKGPPRQQAQAVFEFMHRRILRSGYRLNCTDLRAVVDEGRFNCVSASVLFNVLAGRFGLEACGLEVPGHAMSCLILPDGKLEVETTCPRWFQLTHNPQEQAEAVRRALGRGRGEPPLPGECREVSGVELVATIYYNRGVDLLAAKQFADALSANAKALRLDPKSETSWGNLLAVLNNWAIYLSSSGHYAQAIQLLQQGLQLEPDYKTFLINYAYVHRQWVGHLRARGRLEEAQTIAQRARTDPFLAGDDPLLAPVSAQDDIYRAQHSQ